jgi:hypothetical protein
LGLLLAGTASAELRPFPVRFDLRCGPSAPVVSFTLSDKLEKIISCTDLVHSVTSQESELKATGPLFADFGPNHYELLLDSLRSSYHKCKDVEFLEFRLRDRLTRDWYIVTIAAGGHATVWAGVNPTCLGLAAAPAEDK